MHIYILSKREKILTIIAAALLLTFVLVGSVKVAKTSQTNTLVQQTQELSQEAKNPQ